MAKPIAPTTSKAANPSAEADLARHHARDPEHFSADHLAHAIWRCSLADIRRLLDHGASPNSRDAAELPPLRWAMGCLTRRLPITTLLIKRGAKDLPGADGRTALHDASALGRDECVDPLLAAGSDPRARDGVDATPLILAVRGGHFDIARRLAPLSSLHARDKRSLSAMDYARAPALGIDKSQAHAFLAFLAEREADDIAASTAPGGVSRSPPPRL